MKIVFPDCVAKATGDLKDPNLYEPVDPSISNHRAGELRNKVTGQVIDPDTGQVIDSPDHESHMVKSKLQNGDTRVCPSDHPIPVPTLTVNINFPMPTTSGTVVLSSGDASSIHADFWNTWNQEKPLPENLQAVTDGGYGGLNALVTHCINDVPPDQVRPTECRAPTATGS